MSFKDFVRKYDDGSITDDAAWRAYDIEGMAEEKHARAALALISFGKGKRGDHAYAEIAAWYNLTSATRAMHLLRLWYVWRSIALGERRQAVLRPTDSSVLVGPT